ncbi:uncharacterized protein FIBRA_00216 [Fibroporia radiculosa]|uniref:DUF7729 domain-containing protein n=1 Tax=Fibroporia radiculosa TaxID=599839 RepID=J7RGM5_9APHY|nr:uncharacterized protein FIBRA_00216 [Fibroporia radiculosa]CCL98222.1 predicted protein [Fibroporia radiculosa]
MFTPPASPVPIRTSRSHRPPAHVHGSSSDRLIPSSSPSPPSSRSSSPSPLTLPSITVSPPSPLLLQEEHLRRVLRKRRTARHTRWTVLLIPLVLIIITLSTRYLSHPAVLDVLSPDSYPPGWQNLAMSLLNGQSPRHGRHSKRGQESGATSTVISFQNTSSLPTPTSSSPSTSASSSTPSSTGDASSSVPSIPTAPVLPTPFPQPFTALPQTFSTESCQVFFENMTQAEPFRECRPFSLLFQSSEEFLEAQKNITLLNTMVWGTCNTDLGVEQCTENMGWFAEELQTACASDLSAQNELVMSTLTGLQAYSLMRSVACLPNNTSNTYCYIDAVASPQVADTDYYTLPLAIGLPNNSMPTCSLCMQDTMAEYLEQGQNLTALQATYESAAVITNAACGNGFVQEIETAVTSSALRAVGADVDRVLGWALFSAGVAVLASGGAWL